MCFQCLTWANDNARIGGIQMHYIKWLTRCNTDTAALTNGIMHDAFMTPQNTAIDMYDIARGRCFRLQLGNNVRIFALRHETNVLAILLLRNRQPHLFCNFADLRLRQMSKREAQIINLVLRGGKEEIALIAIRIDRTEHRAMVAILAAADIMAGCQSVRTQFARSLQKISKLDGLIARNTRNRRFTTHIGICKWIDNRFTEARFIIQYIMRNAEAFRNATRIFDVLARAT